MVSVLAYFLCFYVQLLAMKTKTRKPKQKNNNTGDIKKLWFLWIIYFIQSFSHDLSSAKYTNNKKIFT